MRVLILSAILAVAAAAPSGLYASVVVPAVRAVPVPAVIPTISPGDIQAAAIDAQVKALDQAQAAVDAARELSELATENAQEKLKTDSTVADSQNLEAFWNAEDRKWQAVDALKTAEAQIDGVVANNAVNLAKSAVSGVPAYVAAVGPIAPIVPPIPPIVYSSFITPQSYSTQTLLTGQEIKTEIKEENKEAAVKTAEPAMQAAAPEAEKPEAEKSEAEKAEKIESAASPAVKAAENLNEKPALIAQPLLASPFGLASVYRYDLSGPLVGQYVGQPIVKFAPPVQQIHGVLTPTFVKAW